MVDSTPSRRKLRSPVLALMIAFGFVAVSHQGTVFSQSASDDSSGSLAAPRAESENVRLVGYHDLQGRTAMIMFNRFDERTSRNWTFVGHHDSFYDGEPRLNPITNRREHNGTSILDTTDPANPRMVWHIPNEVNSNSRSVSVVFDYMGTGRDYLIRNSEAGDDLKFQIFDITSLATDPSQISLVTEITGTPENSCGQGCGGRYHLRAHKGWWSPDTGLFYAAAAEPGFRQAILNIWDLNDPQNPRFVSRAWLEGQKEGEPDMHPSLGRLHHPMVDEENNRVYAGWRDGSGDAGAFDISDPANPTLVWRVDTSPPYRGPHDVLPIVYDNVPSFSAEALPRTYAFIVDEAGGGDIMCQNPVRTRVYMVDITHEEHPFPVSSWALDDGEFCEKGGRFGPHQTADRKNGYINRFEDRLGWIAYFNAGVRVLDLSNPYQLREIGHFLPEANSNTHPMREGQPAVIQINDMDIDHRGLAYAADRAGTGMFILEYTGPAPTAETTP